MKLCDQVLNVVPLTVRRLINEIKLILNFVTLLLPQSSSWMSAENVSYEAAFDDVIARVSADVVIRFCLISIRSQQMASKLQACGKRSFNF